jgi:hypothetical protein
MTTGVPDPQWSPCGSGSGNLPYASDPGSAIKMEVKVLTLLILYGTQYRFFLNNTCTIKKGLIITIIIF